MRATVLTAPYEVQLQDVPEPIISEPTDALVRVAATCVCGSDLWNYRGINPFVRPRSIGHESIGEVIEVGPDVRKVSVGDFVIIPFDYSDGTCHNCRSGFHNACVHGGVFSASQAEVVRVPLADGTLVPTPEAPDDDLLPDLLTLSDVMGTGWHAAVAAGVERNRSGTVVVVGDGAVGLCGVLAASQMHAERIIAMSRHAPRQEVAKAFGATDIVAERGEEGVAAVLELTQGVGADATLECVGTNDSMAQAVSLTRAGSTVGFVGVPHGVELPMRQMFERNVGVFGGMAPVRHYVPILLQRVWARKMNPARVFDLTLRLDDVAEAYKAMDERRAIKVLLQP
ncbi:zinc-binding dehydrogenase [Propionicicella superfundia]|uniref:zinc-binding dehydrogenase n=1 Tax=Propionicicella superfundia TaxID=348582 RepID=UPI000491933F|nr:alcohol dehydrogenase catalytic domain-containing protein [Propionicicella superfundia]